MGQVNTARDEIILYKILFSIVQNIFWGHAPNHCNPILFVLEFCWGSHTFVVHTSSIKVVSCLNIIFANFYIELTINLSIHTYIITWQSIFKTFISIYQIEANLLFTTIHDAHTCGTHSICQFYLSWYLSFFYFIEAMDTGDIFDRKWWWRCNFKNRLFLIFFVSW